MVSKKKKVPASSLSLMDEPSPKKIRLVDNPGTSGDGHFSQGSSLKLSKSPRKEDSHFTIKEEVLDEIEEDQVKDLELVSKKRTKTSDPAFDWPECDILELISRIESVVPEKDVLRFTSRAKKLPWEEVCFGDYTPDQCHNMWLHVQSRLRGFRTINEMLVDAKEWASRPWTSFYHGSKRNRHPDMPRGPQSSFMLFYLKKKDKVIKENPHLEKPGVSKVITEMYLNLSAKKKCKYQQLAVEERRIYSEKMEQFYQDHPGQMPKPSSSKEGKSLHVANSGPQKHRPPFKLFYDEERRKHKDEPDFDPADFMVECKIQWQEMSDTKKAEWINRCLEEENRYQNEMQTYATEHPLSAKSPFKSCISKAERNLVEYVAGKPRKPPNSGYSLFTRLMLVNHEVKSLLPSKRMASISMLWKQMSEQDQNKFKKQVAPMVEQYKLEYATYLESLPEDKRAEELAKNKPQHENTPKKKHEIKIKEEKPDSPRSSTNSVRLFKGEPEQPPVNVYQLFIKTFMKTASHIPSAQRENEANKEWQLLPEEEKAKLGKQLSDLKQNYIKKFEKFLKRLSQDELKAYSLQAVGEKKIEVSFSGDSDSNANIDSASDSDSEKASDSDDSDLSDSSDDEND